MSMAMMSSFINHLLSLSLGGRSWRRRAFVRFLSSYEDNFILFYSIDFKKGDVYRRHPDYR